MALSRRGLLTGLIALASAPAIVRVESLMPVKMIDWYDTRALVEYQIASDSYILRVDRSTLTLRRPRGMHCVREISIKEARKLMPKEAFTMMPPAGMQRHMDMEISYWKALELTNNGII